MDRNYIVKEHSNEVKIICATENHQNVMNELLNLYKDSDKNNMFMSLNIGDDELSFIVDEIHENKFLDLKCMIYPDVYKIIQIHENISGIDNIGTVSEISSLFTDINISILYVNTYNNNFILVKKSDYDRAINALKTIDYTIIK